MVAIGHAGPAAYLKERPCQEFAERAVERGNPDERRTRSVGIADLVEGISPRSRRSTAMSGKTPGTLRKQNQAGLMRLVEDAVVELLLKRLFFRVRLE